MKITGLIKLKNTLPPGFVTLTETIKYITDPYEQARFDLSTFRRLYPEPFECNFFYDNQWFSFLKYVYLEYTCYYKLCFGSPYVDIKLLNDFLLMIVPWISGHKKKKFLCRAEGGNTLINIYLIDRTKLEYVSFTNKKKIEVIKNEYTV